MRKSRHLHSNSYLKTMTMMRNSILIIRSLSRSSSCQTRMARMISSTRLAETTTWMPSTKAITPTTLDTNQTVTKIGATILIIRVSVAQFSTKKARRAFNPHRWDKRRTTWMRSLSKEAHQRSKRASWVTSSFTMLSWQAPARMLTKKCTRRCWQSLPRSSAASSILLLWLSPRSQKFDNSELILCKFL